VRWGRSCSGTSAQAVSTAPSLPSGPRKRGITSSHLRTVLGGSSQVITGFCSSGSACGRCTRIKRSSNCASPSSIPKILRHSLSLFLPSAWVEDSKYSSSFRLSMIPLANHSTEGDDGTYPLTCYGPPSYSTYVSPLLPDYEAVPHTEHRSLPLCCCQFIYGVVDNIRRVRVGCISSACVLQPREDWKI